jgi:hypothetical protein
VKSVNNGIDPDDLARIGGGSADIGPVPQETLDRVRQSSTPSQNDLSGGCTTLHNPRQDPTDPDIFPGILERSIAKDKDKQEAKENEDRTRCCTESIASCMAMVRNMNAELGTRCTCVTEHIASGPCSCRAKPSCP